MCGNLVRQALHIPQGRWQILDGNTHPRFRRNHKAQRFGHTGSNSLPPGSAMLCPPQARCMCGNWVHHAHHIPQDHSQNPHGSTNPQFHSNHKTRRFGHMGSNNFHPGSATRFPRAHLQAGCTCENLIRLARRILQGRSQSPHGSTNPQFHNTHKPRRFGHMGSNNLRPRFAGAQALRAPQVPHQARCTCGNLVRRDHRIPQGLPQNPHGSKSPQFHNTHKPRRFGHMGSNNLLHGSPILVNPLVRAQ